MPRARNPMRERAREVWLASGKTAKLKDIAHQLGVPESRVRKWKCEDKWDTCPMGAQALEEPRRCGGAPKGNKNGKGAPKGNKLALKTGAYETILFDSLTDEEKELVEAATKNKRLLLHHQIATLIVRERRMLHRIEEAPTIDDVLRIEDAMTRVQAELRRCVDSLVQVEHEERTLKLGKQEEPVSEEELKALSLEELSSMIAWLKEAEAEDE